MMSSLHDAGLAIDIQVYNYLSLDEVAKSLRMMGGKMEGLEMVDADWLSVPKCSHQTGWGVRCGGRAVVRIIPDPSETNLVDFQDYCGRCLPLVLARMKIDECLGLIKLCNGPFESIEPVIPLNNEKCAVERLMDMSESLD